MTDFARIPRERTRLRIRWGMVAFYVVVISASVMLVTAGLSGAGGLYVLGVAGYFAVVRFGGSWLW